MPMPTGQKPRVDGAGVCAGMCQPLIAGAEDLRQEPERDLYDWVKGQAAAYYFRILVRERDDRTGERLARM